MLALSNVANSGTYQMFLRTEANGVMPIPAATRTATVEDAVLMRYLTECGARRWQSCSLTFGVENVLRRRSKGSVNAYLGQGTCSNQRSRRNIVKVAIT